MMHALDDGTLTTTTPSATFLFGLEKKKRQFRRHFDQFKRGKIIYVGASGGEHFGRELLECLRQIARSFGQGPSVQHGPHVTRFASDASSHAATNGRSWRRNS